jgi:hypothetical protein
MDSNENFHKDLEVGKRMELEILKKIQRKYPQAQGIEGKNSKMDIFIPEINKKVEVKQDFKSIYTNNIVIEVTFDGNLSALSLTESDYWVIVDGYKIYWIRPLEIYRCIERNRLNPFEFVGNGDTKEKEAYLIKRPMFEKYCEKIITIEKDETMYYDNFIKLYKEKFKQ